MLAGNYCAVDAAVVVVVVAIGQENWVLQNLMKAVCCLGYNGDKI